MRAVWSALRVFAIGAVGVLGVGYALGQATNSGDIRGTVTDATGALLPDVTVTVVNVETGITKVLTTNHDGLYDTSSIVVGTYSVTFEKQGFSRFERSAVSLEVGTSTVNAVMKVGATTEEVVVNTDLPLLDTESGTQQTTFEAKSMQVLPNVGQDWENFSILLPGTSGSTGSQGTVNPGQEIAANGNLPYSNVLADGATSTLSHSQNADVSVFETVAEVQISTSAFSAQYGIGGIIFNQISKGGTSQFHGNAYDYFQSNQFNAFNFQIPALPAGSKLPPYHYNNFGGSIGGPVKIPVLGFSHKAFFFFNYDQKVNHGSLGGPTYNDVPTPAVMAGQFTATNMYPIYDPLTQTIGTDANGKQYPIRKSFASEYGSNIIPANLFDTVAANFQKFYPTPTNHIPTGFFVPGTTDPEGITHKNFGGTPPTASTPDRRFFGRFDYDITSHNRFTASVTQGDIPVYAESNFTECPIECQHQDVERYNSQVSDVWTINPKLINEARFGYTYQGNFFADGTFGIGEAAGLGFRAAKADDIPNIQFTGNYPYAWIQDQSNAVYKEHVFDPSDVVTMIRGRHVLHFGGEVAFYRDDSTNWGNVDAGTYQFSGQYTQHWSVDPGTGAASADGNTGAVYADFLLGQANNWCVAAGVFNCDGPNSPEYGGRLKNPQVFIQDDYKVRPNLTLNLGLRYQIRRGWSEVHNNIDTYDPTILNTANNTPGAFWYASTHTNGRTSLQSSKYDTVLPRVGFSYLPRPDMTIRGGFGVYAYNLSLDTYGGGLGSAFSSSGSGSDQGQGCGGTTGCVAYTVLGGPGTVQATGAPLPYSSASTSPTRFNGQGVTYTQYNTPTPSIYQWNFGIQQALGTNMAFDLSYVASHGFNLNFPTDINQVPAADLVSNDRYINPNFEQINGSTNNAISNYNSLQAQFNRRLARGLSFNFNYTWSHFLDDQDSSGWGSRAGPQNRQYEDPAHNYASSNFDVRNAFKGLIVYQLPFGRGRQFFNHNFLLDEVFGGYQVSSTIQLTSGQPFTVFDDNDNDNSEPGQTDHPFANRTGAPLYGSGTRNYTTWFNAAAFSSVGSNAFGNSGRNSVYGPGIEYVNISAGKKFDIYENVKLQFRLDATNAFNHPSFGTPNAGLTSTTAAGTAFSGNGLGSQNSITGVQVGGRQLQAGVRLEF